MTTKKIFAIMGLIALLMVFMPTANWFSVIEDNGLIAFVARIGFMAGWSISLLATIDYILPDKYLNRRH